MQRVEKMFEALFERNNELNTFSISSITGLEKDWQKRKKLQQDLMRLKLNDAPPPPPTK